MRFLERRRWSGARREFSRLMELVRRRRGSGWSAGEFSERVGLDLHGLEFARVRHGFAGISFADQDEISFGGSNETPLTGETEALCRDLLGRLFASRRPDGVHNDCAFSGCNRSGGWSSATGWNCGIAAGAAAGFLYSQVPGFLGRPGDAGSVDADRNGRLRSSS